MSQYIPITEKQQKEMLNSLSLKSIDELFNDIPEDVRFKGKLNIPNAMSEMDLMSHVKNIASKNYNTDEYTCFLGAGAYDHYIPSAVSHILSRQEFYTAYTPYQPEMSQGMLQAIFEFQTMICELTGMNAANASMYDGATALAEAAVMACNVTRKNEIIVTETLHPENRQILNTYAKFKNIRIIEIRYKNGQTDIEELENNLSDDTAAVVIQSPNFFGIIEDLSKVSELVHNNKSLLIASVDPISLAILKPPGEMGADIVVGEGQSLGNPLSFGGPYLGFFAVTEKLVRKMPGRIVGQTNDHNGNRGFVLTLQAREQHIRRDKATSNICSNQALNALAATVYLSVMGKKGLKKVAELCTQKAHYMYNALINTGKFEPMFNAPFFKEFAVKSKVNPDVLNKKLLSKKFIGGYAINNLYPNLNNAWLLAVTEKRTKEEIDKFVEKAGEIL